MQPAFAELANSYAAALGRRVDHRHTFAHAPPICDGASLALVGDGNAARVVHALASLRTPSAAAIRMRRCSREAARWIGAQQAGMQLRDVDCIEFMEASQ